LAIVFGLDLSLEEAGLGFAEVEPSSGRLQARTGIGNRLVIDDSYNASPTSMEVAMETARVIAEKRDAPFVAILGDMKELGTHGEEAHRKVGDLVSSADAFLFVGCGEGMHEAVSTANARGTDTLWFEDAAECGELSDRLPLNAVILVKGSRTMQMERVIGRLLEDEQP
ncbi:MAG: hypothetical protein KJN97_11635, partial [Deltaproteobacteria bacterium]|nr:hypothetical protein [Deltaproteobacteria bacterium]